MSTAPTYIYFDKYDIFIENVEMNAYANFDFQIIIQTKDISVKSERS